ncbi:uncharacterized protein N7483_008729 [Penicillium malachiteum]|uniref:uncharacterized protein n=1 Tax=Penicillium malachiteum TaxID=1324776 RepID=UPI00254900BA|nr:uncharacterized protein N7483_008729 [Penicillium malachiteum]KAJ5720795.1 hypothetical protein N7483_008729 [Penicillium malachiteum]
MVWSETRIESAVLAEVSSNMTVTPATLIKVYFSQTSVSDMAPVVLFVPGFWEGPSVFNKVTSLLEADGIATEVAELPSTGKISPGNPTMRDDISAVWIRIKTILEGGNNIILVLHSAGGFIGSEAIEGLDKRSRRDKHGVVGIVFLARAVFPEGYEHQPLPFAVVEPEVLLFGDLPEDEKAQWLAVLKPQPAQGWDDTVRYTGWKDVPSTYLICERDNAVPVPLQEQLAGLAGTYEKGIARFGVSNDGSSQNQLDEAVRRRLQELKDVKLKFVISGREIIVREQVSRAFHVLISAKDLISAAISSDPHASLAWAGVLILLDPIAKSTTQDDDAMDGLEKISHLMIRYRILESTPATAPAGNSTTPWEELEASIKAQIIHLYTEILKYQMQLAGHLSKSGLFRFFDDLTGSDDWKGMIQGMKDINEGINNSLRSLSAHSLKSIELQVEKIDRGMDDLTKTMKETKEELTVS